MPLDWCVPTHIPSHDVNVLAAGMENCLSCHFSQNGFLHLFDTSERLGIVDSTHLEGALGVMSTSADYKCLAVGTLQVLKCHAYLPYRSYTHMLAFFLLPIWSGVSLCGGSIQREPADRGG